MLDANQQARQGRSNSTEDATVTTSKVSASRASRGSVASGLGPTVKYRRPVASGVITIFTHLRVINLIKIDTIAESFSVHLEVELEWIAPSTEDPQHLMDGADRMDVDWEPEWIPRFEFDGATDEPTVLKIQHYTTKRDQTYTITQKAAYIVEINEQMDLQEFPFDIEDVTIVFKSQEPTSVVVLASFPNKSLVDLKYANLALSDYFPFKACPWSWHQEELTLYDEVKQSALVVQIYMARYVAYYFFNIIGVLFLLVTGTLCAWSIDSPHLDNQGSRVMFDMNIILATIAFKFVVAGLLPKVSYMTVIDAYIVMCYVQIFLVFFFHSLQYFFPHALATAEAEMYSLIVTAAVWLVSNFVFWFIFVVKLRRSRQAEVIEQAKHAAARGGQLGKHMTNRRQAFKAMKHEASRRRLSMPTNRYSIQLQEIDKQIQ